LHTQALLYTQTHRHTDTDTHAHTHTEEPQIACIPKPSYTHTHTHTHSHTHTHTHTRASKSLHTQALLFGVEALSFGFFFSGDLPLNSGGSFELDDDAKLDHNWIKVCSSNSVMIVVVDICCLLE